MSRIRTAVSTFAALLTIAAGHCFAESPQWVDSLMLPTGMGEVAKVVESDAADIIVMSGGLSEGFRTGMYCRIIRDKQIIASVVIVEARPDQAAALILELEKGETIQSGDIAQIEIR